ncbi:Splicing factor U2af small subunit A [Nymphaea thermarum]|nr:Splicing factor U2af small subunit A [Nymphaea thermarum]
MREEGGILFLLYSRKEGNAEHLASIFGGEKDKVNCPSYFKIGAWRHGDRCSRLYTKPSLSPTLLFSNMYQRPDMIDLQGQAIDSRKIQEHFERLARKLSNGQQAGARWNGVRCLPGRHGRALLPPAAASAKEEKITSLFRRLAHPSKSACIPFFRFSLDLHILSRITFGKDPS